MNKILNWYYFSRQLVKDKLITAFSEKYIRIYLSLAVAIDILTWISARYIQVKVEANMIALHYSVGFGIDYYGDTIKIYIIPLLGFLIVLLNFILYTVVCNFKDKLFIMHILFAGAIVTNIILLISMLSIYIINF